MSEKPKVVKNTVQTRGKGKSKAGGDSDANKNTQSDKNYDTDEPMANVRADRTPAKGYNSDVVAGGPQQGGEPVLASTLVQGANPPVLVPAARELEPQLTAVQQRRAEELTRGSDAESIRSMRRTGSRASQCETVRKRKIKATAVTGTSRQGPDGLTGEESASEAAADVAMAGAGKKNQTIKRKAQRGNVLKSGGEYYTDLDERSLLSYRSGSSRHSRVSATASEIEHFRRDIAELRRQLGEMKQAPAMSAEQQVREDRRLAEIIQAEYETAVDTDAGEQRDTDRGRPRSQRPPVQQHNQSMHSLPQQSDNNDQQQQRNVGLTAAAGGAPGGGGDDDDDGGDSDRDWYRHHRNRHMQDAARRRAARLSDNQDNQHPPSRTSRRDPTHTGSPGVRAPPSGYINSGFDAGKIAADAVAAASAAWQSLAPTRLHIEQVNLPKFDGKDFLLFHKQFDAVVKEQRWSPETCARKLLESLEGDTRRHVEVSMDYDEMLEALRQYYAGSRPSIEAKNILRHFNKNKDESIEEFASRIQACADGARLTSFDKLKYMQEAFMNGLRNDTKMQRYIEKRTSQHENVHIVKLLKAAQDYLHDKQGSTQPNPTGKAKLNSHKPKGKKQNSDGASEGQPKANVMKGGRKEPLSHDDPAVEQEVEEEQEKAQQSKGGKNKQGSSAWKKRYEEAEKRSNELRDQLQKAIETVTQQAQIQQQQTANFQNRGGNYRNNNWGGNSNYNQRNDNFRNNNGYRNNNGGFRNDGYRSDGGRSDGNRSGWRNNPNYQDSRVFNNSGLNNGASQPPRPDASRPPPNQTQQPASTSAGNATTSAPAQFSKHMPSQTDRYAGVDPSVYPEDGMYTRSDDDSQA